MTSIAQKHVLRGRPLLALALAAVVLGACGLEPKLRDHYFGKSILQPDQVPKPVERDENGDPILP